MFPDFSIIQHKLKLLENEFFPGKRQITGSRYPLSFSFIICGTMAYHADAPDPLVAKACCALADLRSPFVLVLDVWDRLGYRQGIIPRLNMIKPPLCEST